MNPFADAIQDYLALRRSLGFKLRDAGIYLSKFAAFLEARGATHITTPARPGMGTAEPIGSAFDLGTASWLCPWLRAPPCCQRPANRDSAAGPTAVSPAPSATVSLLGPGDRAPARVRTGASSQRWLAPVDLSLSARVAQCGRLEDR